MKLIDKKGRIFGKVNIIDFFLVAFIVSSFVLLAVSYGRFGSRRHAPEETYEKAALLIKIAVPLELEAAAKHISVGEKDIQSGSDYWLVVEDKQIMRPSDGVVDRAYLVLTLRARVQKRANEYSYKGQLLKVNNILAIATPLYEAHAPIVDIKVIPEGGGK